MLKIFNKNKIKIKELQQENNYLRAQVAGLSFNLKLLEEKLQASQTQIQNLTGKNDSLASEVRHLNMLAMTSNNNRNDSKYY
jgi:hypothetical protein